MAERAAFPRFARASNLIFQRRIERHHAEPPVLVAVAGGNGAGQALPRELGQASGILGRRRVLAEGFQNLRQRSNGHAFAHEQLQDLLNFGELHLAGNQLVDDRGR